MNTTVAYYNGKKYRAHIHFGNEVWLFSDESESVKDGFIKETWTNYLTKTEKTRYKKIVTRTELTELYSEYERYYWKGYELNCRSKSETAYELTGLPGDNYRIAEKLGMHIVDKYEYGKWVDKSEVTVKKERENELTGEITVLDS
jgi:hypothetical protein